MKAKVEELKRQLAEAEYTKEEAERAKESAEEDARRARQRAEKAPELLGGTQLCPADGPHYVIRIWRVGSTHSNRDFPS